jgi:glycosyltransferase involved in cell wall biosynthesis
VQLEVATTTADGAGGCLTASERPRLAVPVHWFRYDAFERWKVSVGLAAWLLQHACRFDLLHIHALWTFSTAAACWAARRQGTPYLLTLHGMLSEYTLARKRRIKEVYWHLIERPNLAHAAGVHVTTQSEADDLLKLGIPARTGVVPLGLQREAWQATSCPTLLREKCGPAVGDRPIILCLARLHPIKGIVDVLLPAMTELRHHAFLALVGGQDQHEPGYAEVVRREIKRRRLESDVALLGPVSGAERFTIFDGAVLVVLPSHYESFGLVAAEALARSVPVVVSDRVKFAEHVIAAAAGKVVPVQSAALAAACIELLRNPSERERMGRAGRAYVQQLLAWPKVAEQMIGLYRRVISSRRAAQDGS